MTLIGPIATSSAPLIAVGASVISRKPVGLVAVDAAQVALDLTDGAVSRIIDARGATLPYGGDEVWPSLREKLSGDVAHWVDLGEVPPGLATVTPEGIARTPWLTLMGNQAVGQIVASVVDAFRDTPLDDMDRWIRHGHIQREGFHGAWLDYRGHTSSAHTPGAKHFGDPVATFLALAGLYALPAHDIGWGRFRRSLKRERVLHINGTDIGTRGCVWPIFERAKTAGLIEQWLELEEQATAGVDVPAVVGVSRRQRDVARQQFAGYMHGTLHRPAWAPAPSVGSAVPVEAVPDLVEDGS